MEVTRRAASAGAQPALDLEYAAAAHVRIAENWYSYDTADTLRYMVCYARRRSLGGVFTWDGQQDNEGYELLKAIRNYFSDSSTCNNVKLRSGCPSTRPSNLLCPVAAARPPTDTGKSYFVPVPNITIFRTNH
jgi:hypothetical protein